MMKCSPKATALLVGLSVFLHSTLVFPCTVFQIPGIKPVVGKTLDWWVEHGMAYVNLRGLKKSALLLDPSAATALEWQSLYGSVTFNQVSREFPFGGINEKGLVMEVLWLDDSEFPAVTMKTPSINESQIIQFVLDTAETITEAVQQINSIQVQMGFAPVHYMICDAKGDCATVEYVGKNLKIHAGADLPYAVLANNTYEDHLAYLAGFNGFGGSKSVQITPDSVDRFVVAADRVKATTSSDVSVARAAKIMADVAADNTVWKLVYQDQKVTFATQKYPKQKEINLSHIDFSCKTGQALYFDLQSDIIGSDANPHLTVMTAAQNQTYLRKSVYLPNSVVAMIDGFASSGFPCGL